MTENNNTGKSPRIEAIVAHIRHFVETHVAQEVSPSMEYCEFECKKVDCANTEFECCKRRMAMDADV